MDPETRQALSELTAWLLADHAAPHRPWAALLIVGLAQLINRGVFDATDLVEIRTALAPSMDPSLSVEQSRAALLGVLMNALTPP